MAESSRITIRLSPVLAAGLAAKVGPRGNLADIVRQALEAYLGDERHTRQPTAAPVAATADNMAASLSDIRSRLETLEQHLTALEAVSARTAATPPGSGNQSGRPWGHAPAHPHPAAGASGGPLAGADPRPVGARP